MRYTSYLFFLSILFTSIATNCVGEEIFHDEIVVHLPTEENLLSIYLSSIQQTNGTNFPLSYLKQLEKVLAYDFSMNGKTKVLPKEDSLDANLAKGLCHTISSPYAISFTLQEKNLIAKVYNRVKEHLSTFPEIPLSGVLSQDRRALHKLSDSIHKLLFNTEGIASSKILFSYQKNVGGDSWISEIAECDYDGENIRNITTENSYCVTPVNIPKGDEKQKDLFLYVSYKLGQPKIFIGSKQGGKGKKILDIRGNQLLPAISRKKDKLAFICDASGRADLFVQPINPLTGATGVPVQLFSYPRATQASPTFSPDGEEIAFVSDKDGSPRIYVIPSYTKGKRAVAKLLTKKNKENTCPCWSSDGTKLAYSAKTKGVRQIWIYDFTTGEERQLTSGPGDKENPSFAPNDLHIVFNSIDKNQSDLYVINLCEPKAIKITKGPGKKHYPVWSTK